MAELLTRPHDGHGPEDTCPGCCPMHGECGAEFVVPSLTYSREPGCVCRVIVYRTRPTEEEPFNPTHHLSVVEVSYYYAECPKCDYRTLQNEDQQKVEGSLRAHYRDKHETEAARLLRAYWFTVHLGLPKPSQKSALERLLAAVYDEGRTAGRQGSLRPNPYAQEG